MGLLDNFKKASQAENEEAINELEESMGGLEEDNDFEVYLEEGAASEEESYEEFDEGAFEEQYTIEQAESDDDELVFPNIQDDQLEFPNLEMEEDTDEKALTADDFPVLRDHFVSIPEIEDNMEAVQIAETKDNTDTFASTDQAEPATHKDQAEWTVLKEELEQIQMDLKQLYRKFEDEISYIDKKDNAVAAIREELNSFKDSLYINIIRHMLVDFINIREGISGQVELKRSKGGENMSLEDVSYMIEDFEIILNQNSVEIFKSEPGTKFDPHKHRLVKKVPASDPSQVHTICESKSDGYIFNNSVIYPEKVVVYTEE